MLTYVVGCEQRFKKL